MKTAVLRGAAMASSLGLGLVAVLQLSCVAAAPPQNLVLISVDTLRADHLGAYGYDRATSPNIDRLARRGQRFEHAYAVMPTTGPSHAAMFTSLYPRQVGVRTNGQTLADEALTLAEQLRDHGYATAAFISSVVLAARYGLQQGFDAYGEPETGRATRVGTATVAEASKWLADRPQHRPFFLFVHIFDPHTPYEAPEHLRRALGAPDPPSPPGREFVGSPAPFGPDEAAAAVRAYDAEIAAADEAVGALVDALATSGLDATTVVALVSDHGETLGELLDSHGYAFDHGEFLYEHQLRVPLIFRLPDPAGAGRGVSHATPVSLLDVAPTLLDLLGVEPLPLMLGRSLRPLMEGKSVDPLPVFAERRSFASTPRELLRGDAVAVLRWPWWVVHAEAVGPELLRAGGPWQGPVELANHGAVATGLLQDIDRRTRAVTPLLESGTLEADPKMLERLRALGYIQ